ncbi:MAG TPA: HAD-IB family hydrolase [Steroidobacteraceae bacterium]|nr:HAD-IB family hydrolase [Steroidobacteraceae bacterium]
MLALFDLDGTITRHDTLAAYLAGFLRQHPGRVWRLPQALPALTGFALGRIGHGELKSAWLRAVLAGRTREELEAWTAVFVPKLIRRGLFADAVAAADAHREAGDTLVLMSASPDIYVPAVGRALGFVRTLCTGVEWDGSRLTGRLATPNLRGPEKARYVQALRLEYPGLPIVAYANAASDLDHLALADRAALVNGSARARREAVRRGMASLTWR